MTLLILGATSDIGGEIARRLAPGRDVVLAARRPEAAHALATELSDASRGTAAGKAGKNAAARSVTVIPFEATDTGSHRDVVARAEEAAGKKVTTAVVAFGILGDQVRAEHDEAHAVEIAAVDYLAQVSMLTVLADVMERGEIIAFSSIAGWRARRANYVYGSTKAGLDAFCQGLIDRLHGSPLRVYLARPGFVIGSMTKGMKPAPMSVTPDVVADAVVEAMGKKKHGGTFWIPGRLAILAWIMALVPRPIWRHMPR